MRNCYRAFELIGSFHLFIYEMKTGKTNAIEEW